MGALSDPVFDAFNRDPRLAEIGGAEINCHIKEYQRVRGQRADQVELVSLRLVRTTSVLAAAAVSMSNLADFTSERFCRTARCWAANHVGSGRISEVFCTGFVTGAIDVSGFAFGSLCREEALHCRIIPDLARTARARSQWKSGGSGLALTRAVF